MRYSLSRAALAAALLASSQPAFAATDDTTDEEVVVTASRSGTGLPREQLGSSVTILQPLDLELRQTRIISDVLRDVPGVVSMGQADGQAELRLSQGTDPAAVIREAAARVVPARIEIARITLEDVFVGIVKGQAGGEESEAALRQHLQGLSGEKA